MTPEELWQEDQARRGTVLLSTMLDETPQAMFHFDRMCREMERLGMAPAADPGVAVLVKELAQREELLFLVGLPRQPGRVQS